MKNINIFILSGLLFGGIISRYINPILYLGLGMIFILIYFIENKKSSLYILLGMALVFVSNFVFTNTSEFQVGKNYKVQGEVIKVYEKVDKFQKVEVKTRDNNILSINLIDKENLELYDNISSEIEILEDNTSKNFNMFSSENYKYVNKISGRGKAISLEVNKNKSLLKNYKISLIKSSEKSINDNLNDLNTGLIKKLVLNKSSSLDENLNDTYRDLGLSHLLAISGLHIFILIEFFDFVLLKLKVSFNLRFYCILLVLLFYSYILNFPPSINRALLMYSIRQVSNIKKIKMSNFDVILFSMAILLTIKPRYVYDLGFQLSYLSVIGINYFNGRLFKNASSKVLSSLGIYLSVNIFLYPILALNFNNYNIFSFIANMFMTPLLILALILSYISFALDIILGIPYIYKFIDLILDFGNFYIVNFNNFFDYKFKVFLPDIYFVGIYYSLLFLCFNDNAKNFIYKNYKYLSFGYFFVFLILIKEILFPSLYIGFFDVGQGDSSYIIYKDKYFQIDTGGTIFDGYNPGVEVTGKGVVKRGIDKIDLLILSHFDYDHVLGTSFLVEEGLVDTLVSNPPKKDEILYNEIANLTVDFIYPKESTKIYIDEDLSMTFYNTGTTGIKDSNDSSLVVMVEYLGKKALFTGDISSKVEEKLLDYFGQVDILKISHHGSDTGSSDEFINHLRPTYSVISVGRNNSYGHPTETVLERLRDVNSRIIRTDEEGEILFKINNDISFRTYNNQGFDIHIFELAFSGIISYMTMKEIRKKEEFNELQ